MGVKVLTVIGTRPEAIKLFPLVHALEADPRFESRVCVTGQHREMVDELLRLTAIRPDHDLRVMCPHQTPAQLAAGILAKLEAVLERERPEWVVVQGDTTTALAAALCAHYHAIPVCHVEAGLRSGDLASPWPEEAHRRMIAGIARVHCSPTDRAAASLRAENVSAEAIHITGNTVVDAVYWMVRALQDNPALNAAADKISDNAGKRRLVLLTMHRRENWGSPLRAVAAAIRTIARRDDVQFVIPLHPNPEVRAVFVEDLKGLTNVGLVPPLSYPDFIGLLSGCHMVVTDSGGVQEEAPILGKPVLVLRTATERWEGVAGGTARLIGTDSAAVVNAIEELLDDPVRHHLMSASARYYGDGAAGPRVLAAISQASGLARIPIKGASQTS